MEEGFVEYRRKPLGFFSARSGWHELVLMCLVLKEVP